MRPRQLKLTQPGSPHPHSASLVRVYLSTTDHWRASTLSFLNSRDDGVDFNSTFNCTMTSALTFRTLRLPL